MLNANLPVILLMFATRSVLQALVRSASLCGQRSDPTVNIFDNMTYVFVYGTLKKGQPNHHCMVNEALGKGQYCGRGVTMERYPLVVAGKYNIPFLLDEPGSGKLISGEVYAVDSRLLQYLDEFENCPEMYQRKPVMIRMVEWNTSDKMLSGLPDANGTLQCDLYCTNIFDREWLKLPTYSNYDAFGKFGQPKYVLRADRS
ncbi:gamma-glutamylaminecyclotransferase-like [Hypanus sabinus]|uniref:gamma-glutamylaminecyclotransferase-like n=1 Tax=Hypanus sabinus TaxID=79690 RepID=UPI0028C4DDC9|nr:gamma-glutamylaminecyclotransferase-like [Hypanus sabinus]XP_059826500.1 gamma-glutamylaminecyclotransferase-like [Hypanus sabinus]XP_059826501.1 gamma-glutamylaminecyclotransferase-like [Hypanus sabinus]XP_059826502.1 gamma-glutamylaminecyclotransferase-like [Hypanus sabinus]XP_059826503.1 gamma-glutamylaminecyclotransferase-like [Hypanus sabinus]XP_059826504.1 gamma-glutamylaminecyclotransferase-like [Hypanus sabinus]